MRKILGLIIVALFVFSGISRAQTKVETANYLNNSPENKTISFDELGGIFYASEDPNLKITFEGMYDYAVYFDANDTELLSNTDIFFKRLTKRRSYDNLEENKYSR
jgi:hypothetical protein